MDTTSLGLIRQSFGNVVYTHAVHENEARSYNRISKAYKRVNIIVNWLILVSLVGPTIIEWHARIWIGIVFSVVGIILLIILLSFNAEELTRIHKNTALSLLSVREEYMVLMKDIINNKPSALVDDDIHKLNDKLASIYKNAPITSNKSYRKAQKNLNNLKGEVVWEDFTLSDQEIDRFLPTELKSTTYLKM